MEPDKQNEPTAPAEQSQPAAAAPAPPEPADDENALETPEGDAGTASSTEAAAAALPPPKKKGGFKALMKRINFYLLLFVFILVLAILIITISYFQGNKTSKATVKSQSLTNSSLQQIANSDATVGDPKQVLNIESNAVFAGSVLVRSALQIAGNLTVGGTLSLNDIDVTGVSSLAQLNVTKNLAVSGDSALQGALTLGKSLQVNGTGTFNGAISAPEITTPVLNINGNLTLTHHITAGGASPSHVSGSAALGSGGSASVGGSDTSGTVSVNTGSGPASGCFITVNFTQPFDSTPHVIVTPVGSAAGGLAYYVTRNTTSFSICDAAAPPAGSSFAFDYFIVD
jgi:cytoskeletal protein CcmA (bactofilin family)